MAVATRHETSSPGSRSAFIDLGKPQRNFWSTMFLAFLGLVVVTGIVVGFWGFISSHMTESLEGVSIISIILIALNIHSYSKEGGGFD